MVLVRKPTMDEWQVLRDIRLAALADAPHAFDSTYVEQAAFQEADWRRRISHGTTFFGYVCGVNGTEPAGLVGGLQEEAGTVQLVSLWVRPQARGLGVGEALVAAVIDWAKARNASTVHLWLTETKMNKYARLLYERCGFLPTGERQPLPSKPNLKEVGMARSL